MAQAADAGDLRSVEDAMVELQVKFLEFAAEVKVVRAKERAE
jgi:hypothetical protein